MMGGGREENGGMKLLLKICNDIFFGHPVGGAICIGALILQTVSSFLN